MIADSYEHNMPSFAKIILEINDIEILQKYMPSFEHNKLINNIHREIFEGENGKE
jgi:hypothetical protein